MFVANGFTKDNVRLQPWRYVSELAFSRAEKNNVILITEGIQDREEEKWRDNFTVIQTKYFSVKHQNKLKELILSLNPQELWWSTTPRSVAFYSLLSSVSCKTVAFITCPLYSWAELIKAAFAGVPFHQSKALWQQRIIPRFVFRWMLNKNFIEKVIVQSKKNKTILTKEGVKKEKLGLIPVGVDNEDFESVSKDLSDNLRIKYQRLADKVIYLYFGALRPIRGFDSLINAFELLAKKNAKAHLLVLARGAEENKCKEIMLELDKKGLSNHVTIIGGWLSREEVWAYIEFSDAAVLPFVLVPSDIPIAVLEAMARGKPVVVSHVDGLPEMVEGRGLIVDPTNASVFADELHNFSNDHERRRQLGNAAQEYMNNYPRWHDVGVMIDDMAL